MTHRRLAYLALSLLVSSVASAQSMPAASDPPVYVAYYWRARPGLADAYNAYIKEVAEPIDEDARRAGAFEEVTTVTPSQMGTSAPVSDWTHLRIFKLKSRAAAEALGGALDAATRRVVPDEARRKANSERSALLRDFVRQEVWQALK